MTSDHANLDDPLPLSILERVDRKCLEFEAAWVSRKSPRMEDFLPDMQGAERSKAFRELLLLDLDYRLHNSETPTPAEYDRRFPADANLVEEVFRKILTESGEEAVDETASVRVTQANLCATGDASRYRILRRHAQGGLGEVLVAHDRQLNREVALKELQPRHADNVNLRARFMREAEITGALEHPGIVPVHSLGSYADGRLFYTMRFIDGVRLTDSAKDYHDSSVRKNSADRSIEFRKLLLRFIDVCQTIEYAHSRGVLHRDLKPENIMLGKYGETIIVDWGLAKTRPDADEPQGSSDEKTLGLGLADTDLGETKAGSAIGTPAFMSPEQAAGQRDRIGARTDVYGLGAKNRELRVINDRETAARRQSQQRFNLAMEAIECYYTGVTEDIVLREPKLADLRKRMPSAPLAFYEKLQDNLAGDDDPTSRTALADAYAAVAAITQQIGDFEQAVVASKKEIAIRETLAEETSTSQAVQCDLINSYNALGKVHMAAGERGEAEVPFRKAAAVAAPLAANNPSAAKCQSVLAQCYNNLATVSDVDKACDFLSQAIQIQERLVAECPDVALYQCHLARHCGNLGKCLTENGRSADAGPHLLKAIEIVQRLVKKYPNAPAYREDLSSCDYNMAHLQRSLGNPERAIEHMKRALAVDEELARASVNVTKYQWSLLKRYNNLGPLLCACQRLDEAGETYDKAIAVGKKLVANEPMFAHYAIVLSGAFCNSGNLSFRQGDVETSVDSYANAIATLEPILGTLWRP